MRRKSGNRSNESVSSQESFLEEYCRYPSSMSAGNEVTLLLDGAEAYPSMIEAIRGAEKSILMDSYIFHDDKAGGMFADALCERASKGVAVYLIVDGLGTINVGQAFFDKMESAGIEMLVYRPPAPWRRGWGLLRRDHRKLLVVDGKIGFAGGLNIGKEWLPKDKGGYGWHDIHVRVSGPAVRDLSKLAISTWKVHGGVDLSPRLLLPELERTGSEYVSIVGSGERKKRKAIRHSYMHAIRRAQRYIFIANGYFLPGIGFRRALRNAVARGVEVQVMVPANGDILFVQMASQALFDKMLRAGIRIYQWQEAVLHAKTAVIDDVWATVGSYNIDHRSWAMNLEVNVNILGTTFAQRLKEVFVNDKQRCIELTRSEWKQRPFFQRLLEIFFYQFRRFM